MIKRKNLHILNIGMSITCIVVQCHQKLPVNRFKWAEDISEFNEDFVKSYKEESNEGYFLELHVQYPKNLIEPHNYLPFLLETKEFNKIKESCS